MNPNFLQGNKDHQMRLLTHFSSIHSHRGAHICDISLNIANIDAFTGGR